MDVEAERELEGERMVGRLVLRHDGGRVVRGRVGAYSAAFDRFFVAFDDGAALTLDWDELEELVPLLPFAKQREAKAKAAKEVKAGTGGVVSRANELAVRALRSQLITLVEANHSADPDHKQSVLRGLKDRRLTHAEALKRFAKCRSGSMIEDAVLALAQAEDKHVAAGVGVGVVLDMAAAGPEPSSDSAARTARDKMCALWRWQKGVGSRAELEDAAEWGLRAWRCLGASNEPKTEPKGKPTAKAKAEPERIKPKPKPKIKRAESKNPLTTTSNRETKRPRPADSPPAPAPTEPSVVLPVAVSPPSVARPPVAETPKKKPRPLLYTARVGGASGGSEKDGKEEAPGSRPRRVRFHDTARVLSFRADDTASAVAASPARVALRCSRTLSWL